MLAAPIYMLFIFGKYTFPFYSFDVTKSSEFRTVFKLNLSSEGRSRRKVRRGKENTNVLGVVKASEKSNASIWEKFIFANSVKASMSHLYDFAG